MFVRMASPKVLVFLAIAASLAGIACKTTTPNSSLPSATNETRILPSEADIATEHRIAALAHFAHGMSLELNQEASAAIDAFWQSLINDPANFELALDVSRRLLAEGEKAKALVLLKESAGQSNAPSQVHAWLAIAQLQNGQTNEAIASTKVAIKSDPGNFPAYQNLAQIYLQNGQTNEATGVLEKAAAVKNTSPEFLMALSDQYLRYARENILAEKEAEAIVRKLLERIGAQGSENPLVLSRMADLYLALGENDKAAGTMEKLLAEFPNAPGVKEKLAELYLRADNKEKAAEYFEKIRRERPTDPLSHYILGSLAFEQRDLAKAESFFETTLRLNPNFEPVYYELAGTRLGLKKTKEAIELLDEARKKFKLSFVMEYYTGVAKASAEQYQEALGHFTSAELLAKNTEPNRLNAQFYFQVGAAQERVGNIPDSVKAFRQVLNIDPKHADALNYLGYMWAERGENLAEAYELIRRALEIEPENPAFIDSFAWVLYKLDRSKEALEQMLKAISLMKEEDATLLDHLGDIYAALDEKEKAQEAWRKSLAIQANEKVQSKLDLHRASPR